MKIYIGTSGWFYDWNLERTLDWYVLNSKLNAVELNASFYRFPFPNQIKSWSKKGTDLRWAVKVNRRITHLYKFGKQSFELWDAFYQLFTPMHKLIDFFLFQLPPSLTPSQRKDIERFVKYTKLNEKFALEPRNNQWFNNEQLQWAKAINITWVSIDAPQFPNTIFKTNDYVYLRMHGRESWYHYDYSQKELADVSQRIFAQKPKFVYVFFNNDQSMLHNAQMLLKLMNKQLLQNR
ncbi:MAG: DUF72 domain-containing protein [candidate division WOR-3 bacterium]